MQHRVWKQRGARMLAGIRIEEAETLLPASRYDGAVLPHRLCRSFAPNWSAVKLWNEESRYERHSEAEARELYRAIGEPTNGVLHWIQQHG